MNFETRTTEQLTQRAEGTGPSPYARRFRLSTFTRRLPAALGYLAALTRKPADLAELARSLGAAILDDRHARHSPIPPLPGPLARAFGRYAITFPPADLFSPGNQDLAGLSYIVSVARALEVRTAFEIGTFNGRTALALAMNLPEATIHTLDLPEEVAPGLPVAGHDFFLLHQPVARVYEGRRESRQIVQLLGDSARFDFTPYEKRCQLVYVDGAHSFEYVANDTEVAFRLVDDCAAIIWDDYWRPAEAVVRYLNRQRHLRLFRLPDTRLVLWLSNWALDRLVGRLLPSEPPDPRSSR
jgi:hypothetical protein